jgi:putative membrane protein
MKQAAEFFSEEQKQRIEAAVREAEARTSGEIVPMVVDESFDYPRAEILGGGLFALATAVTLSWAFGHSSVWVFLPLFVLFYFPFKLLIGATPALKRRLIPAAEIDAEVQEKALVSFLEQGLHRTREETGILILISLFEHRVQILADRGISSVVAQQEWDDIVARITAGIHAGRTTEALCEAVRRCGDLLQERFPARHDNVDELPNLILP